MELCYSHFLHKALFSISLAERPFCNTAALGARQERGRSGGGGGSASASSRGGLAGSGHPAHPLGGTIKVRWSSWEPSEFPLGTAMSTPAKRHCQSPAGSLESSFQKRIRKISIEGNIGELGGAGGGSEWWGNPRGRGGGGRGVVSGREHPKGLGCRGRLGERERGGCGACPPSSADSRRSAGRAALGPEPGARVGRMGSPPGQGARQSHQGAGRAPEHKPPGPPGPSRAPAVVRASPPAPSPSACAVAPSLSSQAPPTAAVPKMSAAPRPPLSPARPGAALSGIAD